MKIDRTTEKLLQHPVLKKHLNFEHNFIDIAGEAMHYLDEGSGPCILLLHGNPTWSFFYRNLLNELKESFRVIAPDFLGLGLSARPKDKSYRAADRIDHLEELLEKLGISSYSLVMHDWGGSIGSALALRDLSKVERLVYLNTTLTETEALPAFIKTAAMPIIGKYLTKTSNRFLKFLTTLGAQKKVPKDIKKGFFLPYKTSARRAAIWDFVADIPFDERHPSYEDMLDLAEGLPELARKPVQIVWGLKDPCFHREMLSKVAEHFPDARVLELPHASHLVLEDAFDEASACIRDFFLKDEKELCEENGGQKLVDLDETQGLYPYVKKYAQENPEHMAVMVPSFLGDSVKYAQCNYKSLMALVNKYQRGLQDLGLEAGDKVVMLVTPGVDFLALSLAIMGRAGIPCFLDPGMGKEKLCECIENLKPQAIIASAKAQALRFFKPKLFKNLKFHLIACDWFLLSGPTLSVLKKYSSKPLPERKSSGIGMLAFTSGATGSPKAVVFSDEMIRAQLDIFQHHFGLEPGKKDLPLLPIFSLFNVGLGICSVFPPVNPSQPIRLNPAKVVQLIKDLRIEYSFGSPTLWRKIAEYCVRSRTKLSGLQRIHIAGTAVDKSLLTLLEEVQSGVIATPYGATEALPVTLAQAKELLAVDEKPADSGEQGVCVGKPLSSLKAGVIQATDSMGADISTLNFLPAGQIGEIVVSGDNVSKEYFENEHANKKGKIVVDGVVWHRMGDMGYFDEDGNLYFCGRKVHMVHTDHEVFYSVPVEQVFNQHAKVARSALVGVTVDGVYSPAVVVEPVPKHWPESNEKQETFIKELQEMAGQHERTREVSHFFFHQSFPVDGRHNAKIFRDKLAVWAQALVADSRKIASS